MKRVWHRFERWEDYRAGMWRQVGAADARSFLARAIDFTGDAALYGSYMRKVIKCWPIACEHNLTDTGMNRKAWVGHAACCMAIGCPEDVTRAAWAHLTQQQQDDANAQAQAAIEEWEADYAAKSAQLHPQMEIAGLLGWSPGFCGTEARGAEQGA